MDFLGTLIHCIQATSSEGLLTGYLAYQVIMLELQRCINSKKLPTGGLIFDADHAAALIRFEIIVCQDTGFSNSLKTLSTKVSQKTEGQWQPQIVSNAKQLEKAIMKLNSR